MKKSELIQRLQKEVSDHGDHFILNVKITDEHGTSETYKLSLTRRDKHGSRCKMSFKEFEAWVREQA